MLLLGRALRKAKSQTWGYAVFRWVVIWCIVVSCASKGQPGAVAALVIIAMDVISVGTFRTIMLAVGDLSNSEWLNHLTHRFFYKHLIEHIRSDASTVDVDELFKIASQEAVDDIKAINEPTGAFDFDSTAWHWFGGVISFFGQRVSYVLYYGSALYVGSNGTFQL